MEKGENWLLPSCPLTSIYMLTLEKGNHHHHQTPKYSERRLSLYSAVAPAATPALRTRGENRTAPHFRQIFKNSGLL